MSFRMMERVGLDADRGRKGLFEKGREGGRDYSGFKEPMLFQFLSQNHLISTI